MSITVTKIRGVTVPAPEWMGGEPIKKAPAKRDPKVAFAEQHKNVRQRVERRRARVVRMVDQGMTKPQILAAAPDMTVDTLDNDLHALRISCRQHSKNGRPPKRKGAKQ